MTTGKERLQILEMIDQDAITAEEGLNLIRALESPADHGGQAASHLNPFSAGEEASDKHQPTAIPDPEGLLRWKRWWMIPFLAGIVITFLGGGWMYTVWSSRGFGFPFLLTWIPFLLGVLILATAWDSRNSPWLHLRVHYKSGAKPGRIGVSFPIPFRLIAWTIHTFRNWIPDMNGSGLNDLILTLQESTNEHLPLIVDVDEGEEGEKIQVIIA